MGLRDRLEEIRANNLELGTQPEVGPSPPGVAFKDYPQPERQSPFVSMWFRPTRTIRHVVLYESELWAIGIGVATGIVRALNRSATQNFGDRLRLDLLLGLCLILGPAMQLLSIYVGGAILRACGTLFRSQWSYAEVRVALAWGSLPQAAMLVPWLVALAVFHGEMFSSNKPTLALYPSMRYAVLLFYVLDLAFVVWSVVLTLRALTAVFRRSVGYVILSCLVMTCLIVGTVVGWLVLLSALRTTFDPGRFSTTTTSTTTAAPGHRARLTPRPSRVYAPAAAALWDEGFAVRTSTREGRNWAVTDIELGADLQRNVSDRELEQIAGYKDLLTLTIRDASGVTNAGLAHLAGLTDLRSLVIEGAPGITSAGLANLSALNRLWSVRFTNCPGVTGEGLDRLGSPVDDPQRAEPPRLNELVIANGRITAVGLIAIVRRPPRSELSLNNVRLEDADLIHFAPMQRIPTLRLRDNQINGPGLAALAKAQIDCLDLTGNPLSNEAVEHLARMSHLKELRLARTQFSASKYRYLERALPGVRISLDPSALPDER